MPMQEFIIGDIRRPLLILLGAVGVVLLDCLCERRQSIARARRCAPSRGGRPHRLGCPTQRHGAPAPDRERAAVGASADSPASCSPLAAMQVLSTLRPAGLPRVEEAAIDLLDLAFTAGLSILTGMMFGLAPASQLSRQPFPRVLNESGRGGAPGKSGVAVRRGLVVAQLACSVVLVVGAGLLLRSLVELNRIDLGFRCRAASSRRKCSCRNRLCRRAKRRRLLSPAHRAAGGAVPGVAAAGAVRVLPLARTIGDWSITIEGRPLRCKSENPERRLSGRHTRLLSSDGNDACARSLSVDAADREDAEPVVRHQRHDGRTLLARPGCDRQTVSDGRRRQPVCR